MRQCWRFFLTLVATLAFAETSSAADLPGAPVNPPAVAPSFDWSGLYLGIEGGGGNGSSKKASVAARARVNLGLMVRLAAVPSDIISNGAASSQGLEGDFSWSGVAGKTSCPNRAFTCETNTTWLATVRPRAGYALGNFMPYVTGGLVVGDVNVKSFLNSTGNQGVDFNKTQLGWTAGAGIEVSIYSNWSLKAEYLYVRLADTNGPSDGPPVTSTTNFSENILRGGLNYSFK